MSPRGRPSRESIYQPLTCRSRSFGRGWVDFHLRWRQAISGETSGTSEKGENTLAFNRDRSSILFYLGRTHAAIDANWGTRWLCEGLTIYEKLIVTKRSGFSRRTAISYSRNRMSSTPCFLRRNTGKGRAASLRSSIPASSVTSRMSTSAYRTASSYVMCPSITSGPSQANRRASRSISAE
jgi:hypothetical protein